MKVELDCHYDYWTMNGPPGFVDIGDKPFRVALTVWLGRSRIALYVVPA